MTFFWIGHPRRSRHNVYLRLIVTILVIAAAPVWALAQNSTPAKVSKTDAQKVLKIISGDKTKTSNLLPNGQARSPDGAS